MYRQLMTNYENAGYYSLAGDFYVGAMEMERRVLLNTIQSQWKGWRGLKTSLHLGFHNVYRFVSLYGESYWRALIFLVLITAFLGFVYALGLGYGWRGPIEALRVATFQRPSAPVKDSVLYVLSTSFQLLTTVPIATLFILALKRRFRR